jgi:hypothetical protein
MNVISEDVIKTVVLNHPRDKGTRWKHLSLLGASLKNVISECVVKIGVVNCPRGNGSRGKHLFILGTSIVP